MAKHLLKISSVLIGIMILFSGCNEKKIEKKLPGKYSISLGEFQSSHDAEEFKLKLDAKLFDSLKIDQSEQNLFKLKYGNYYSSFDAGKKAFELHNSKLIDNYNVIFEDDNIPDLYANVLFIARYQGRPSVYIYNIPAKQSKLFWSRWGRKVIAINQSADRNSVFITTALGYGQQGSFPYVKDARVYLFGGENNLVNEVGELGDGFQIYTYWENKDTFKVNFTHPDSVNTVEMIQQIVPFDLNGNEGRIIERNFKLTEQGFPVPPNNSMDFISPKGNFQLREVDEGKESYLYIKDIKTKAEVLLNSFKGTVKSIKWNSEDKYLFTIFHDVSDSTKEHDELMILSTNDKKVLQSFTGQKIENLLVQGNLLFFDWKKDNVSKITIFDCQAGTIYDEISIYGGCGINNLY